MEEIVFEPLYPKKNLVILYGCLVASALVLVLAVIAPVSAVWRTAVSFAAIAVPVTISSRFVRRIVFGKNVVVVRYLFHDKYYNYREILSMNGRYIATVRGNIPVSAWRNIESLRESIGKLKTAGRIDKEQFRDVGEL